MFEFIQKVLLTPSDRHPASWKPAFVAMQLGFIAGGFGLLGRALLIFLTVEAWFTVIADELMFAVINA